LRCEFSFLIEQALPSLDSERLRFIFGMLGDEGGGEEDDEEDDDEDEDESDDDERMMD